MRKELLLSFLKSHTLFQDLIPQELDSISSRFSVREIDAGKLVFCEGDNADFLCLVVQGELEVLKRAANAQQVVIATLSGGDAVGEMALIDGMVRSATVKAAMYSMVIVLKRGDFEQIVKSYPRIGTKILKGIARNISLNLRRTSSALSKLMLPIA